MRAAYPVVFTKIPEGYIASAPDFPLDTEGKDLAKAIYMARDAIGLAGICLQDDGSPIPAPSTLDAVPREDGDIVSMVDIDFDRYRRDLDRRNARRRVLLRALKGNVREIA